MIFYANLKNRIVKHERYNSNPDNERTGAAICFKKKVDNEKYLFTYQAAIFA